MQISILFVDDEQKVLDELIQGYSSPVYSVYHATSAQQAIDILNFHPIDILVTDFQMPIMNGLELVKLASKRQKSLHIIFMIEQDQRSVAVQAIYHHPVTIIHKPVHYDELRVFIEHYTDLKKTKEELHQQKDLLTIEATTREQIEKNADRALTARIAISALLETSLESLTLEKQVAVILEIILTIPWFSTLHKGVLFFIDENNEHLEMIGQKDLSAGEAALCARVPLGHCLCGKAGKQRDIIFVNQIDQDHVNCFDGMQPHGHYCVPIINSDRLLGVLCIFLTPGHQRKLDEDALMGSIGNTLSLILKHRQTEIVLRKAEERLRFMAYHDSLTGLYNRQYFDVIFNKLFITLQNTKRRHNELRPKGAFLAILDIDFFKKVNDTYGHLIGDEVLVLFARVMVECFRDKDASFRFGGEEFVVLLNDVSPEEAESALNRFRKMIEAYSFPQVGKVTVSIGAIQIPEKELSNTLIEKADKALYFSKKNGRNQVNLYHDLIASGLLEDVSHDSKEVDLW
ncbi:MAG: diguanylate cyclase [Magnetococcales bacterium]|nr:diguanylate cyclase [Magnetococcales bacterium]